MTWVHHDGGRMTAGLADETGDNESTVTTTIQSSSGLDRMAEHFYGYGRWEAPFWFIGPEAGMAKIGDGLERRHMAWEALGYAPVVDCATHHRGFGFTKWHHSHPPTQATWRQLIRLLLAYQGKPDDLELIRKYQRDKWGNALGETCVIELSGLASPRLRLPQDRSTFLSKRIERIRREVLRHQPKFVVMYGKGQRKEWEKIAGTELDSNGLCYMGKTVATVALHPVTTGLTSGYWVNLGRTLRRALEEHV